MTCVHLQKLYRHCEEHSVRLSSSDLVHFVCLQCRREEVCPGTLMEEYDLRRTRRDETHTPGSNPSSNAATQKTPRE